MSLVLWVILGIVSVFCVIDVLGIVGAQGILDVVGVLDIIGCMAEFGVMDIRGCSYRSQVLVGVVARHVSAFSHGNSLLVCELCFVDFHNHACCMMICDANLNMFNS